jgi:hypothetical protein
MAEAAGFKPLFLFDFPIARGWMPTWQVPSLFASHVIWTVSTVPDAARFDVGVLAGYFGRAMTVQDSLDFIALGGRVTYWWPDLRMLAGDLPNASVAALRAEGVTVEASSIGCLAASSDLAHQRR